MSSMKTMDGGLVDEDGGLIDRDKCLVDEDRGFVFCRDGGGGLTLNNDDDSGLVSSEDDGDGRFAPVSWILLQMLSLWHQVEHGLPARWQEHCLLWQPFLQLHDLPYWALSGLALFAASPRLIFGIISHSSTFRC